MKNGYHGFNRNYGIGDEEMHSTNKCRVGIMRQSRVGGSASAFNIFLDGVKTTTIKNGGMTQLVIAPGRHILGFGNMGSKISGSITLDLKPGDEVNVMCYMKASGKIEADLTAVDVCSLANSNQAAQPQSGGGNGCLIAFIIIFLLFAFGILSLKFTVFFVPG